MNSYDYKNEAEASSPDTHDNDIANITQEKGIATGEAADVFGDLQTAEEYGYVSRGYVNGSSSYSPRESRVFLETLSSCAEQPPAS